MFLPNCQISWVFKQKCLRSQVRTVCSMFKIKIQPKKRLSRAPRSKLNFKAYHKKGMKSQSNQNWSFRYKTTPLLKIPCILLQLSINPIQKLEKNLSLKESTWVPFKDQKIPLLSSSTAKKNPALDSEVHMPGRISLLWEKTNKLKRQNMQIQSKTTLKIKTLFTLMFSTFKKVLQEFLHLLNLWFQAKVF